MKNISKVVSSYVKEVDPWRINTGYTRYLSHSSLEVEQELEMCLGMSQNMSNLELLRLSSVKFIIPVGFLNY